jgi:hypothetical protein
VKDQAASKNSSVSKYQLWQHHNKPIELWSTQVIEQKANYIRKNPFVAGFVDEDEHWRQSRWHLATNKASCCII